MPARDLLIIVVPPEDESMRFARMPGASPRKVVARLDCGASRKSGRLQNHGSAPIPRLQLAVRARNGAPAGCSAALKALFPPGKKHRRARESVAGMIPLPQSTRRAI